MTTRLGIFGAGAGLALMLALLGCPPVTAPEKDGGGSSDAASATDSGGVDGSTNPDASAARDAASGRDSSGGGDASGGPCQTAVECPSGQACRVATGQCASCRLAQECRPGEGCVDGLCTTCGDSADCSGGICDGLQCRPCVAPDDDTLCASAYGDAEFACDETSGTCAPQTCVRGADCWLAGRVCSTDGRCVACGDTEDCIEALYGEYPARTSCILGVCVEGDCQDSEECPADKPVCGADFRCRGCQVSAECLAREGVTAGYVCDTETGLCRAGDCAPNATSCDAPSNGVCEGFNCRACLNAQGAQQDDCHRNGYSNSVLCVGGECITAECNDVVPCTSGRVCDGNVCVDCNAADDSYCSASGQVCDTATSTCVGCLDDPDCSGGQRICDNTECRDCLPGECGVGFVCTGGACVAGDCWIDGQARDNSEANPDNPCQICNRLLTQFAWSANPGVGCEDGNDCTYGDLCGAIAGVCVGQPELDGTLCATGTQTCHGGTCGSCLPGECGVGKVCVAGTCVTGNCNVPADCGPAPECQQWTCPGNTCVLANDDSAACEDGDPCTTGDNCLSGVCQAGGGTPDCSSADTTCHAGACSVVNPSVYECLPEPVAHQTGCETDVLSCTTQWCGDGAEAGQCVIAYIESDKCFIDDTCHSEGLLGPSECKECVPLTSQTEWQSARSGEDCGSSACEQICVGTSCLDRWYNDPFGRPCSGGGPCVLNRLGKNAYYYLTDDCPRSKNYADAVAACALVGFGGVGRLLTLAEYQSMSRSGCQTNDCIGQLVQIAPAFEGKVRYGGSDWYWTSDNPGGGQRTIVRFGGNVDPIFQNVDASSWDSALLHYMCTY